MKASIQLWSLNRVIPEIGIKAALKLVAEAGYSGVEFAGFGDIPAEEMAVELQKNGLYSVGSHTGIKAFENDLEKNLEYNKKIGSEYMIIPSSELKSADDVKKLVNLLNKSAETAKSYGIKVGYHNHEYEFEKINNKYILDIIAEETSADVIMEIDAYWVEYADENVYEYIKKLGKKVELVHFKQIGSEKSNPRLPYGDIDFARLKIDSVFAKHFIVEQEDESDQIESAKINMEYLKSL